MAQRSLRGASVAGIQLKPGQVGEEHRADLVQVIRRVRGFQALERLDAPFQQRSSPFRIAAAGIEAHVAHDRVDHLIDDPDHPLGQIG